MEENKIPEMRPQFKLIKKQSSDGKEYWTSRDLYGAMGYTTYYRYASVIKKAIAVAQAKGMDVNNHFHLTVEMVKLGSGAYRKVENFHLSRMACFIIAENADAYKVLVQQAPCFYRSDI